jgi:succinyl-CoA synthetase beta subunit
LKLNLPLVVRLSGTNEEEGRQILKQHGIEPGASAWEAAQKIVELTKAGVSSPLGGEVARSAGGAE